MAGYWLFTALGTYLAPFVTRLARRVTLVVSFAFLGALLLFLFVLTKPLVWNLAIFELRPIVNNAHFALNTALTMEYALPQHRGKWASLGSLSRVTYAGSAVLGGYISDAYGTWLKRLKVMFWHVLAILALPTGFSPSEGVSFGVFMYDHVIMYVKVCKKQLLEGLGLGNILNQNQGNPRYSLK